jgi:hypothetical protein
VLALAGPPSTAAATLRLRSGQRSRPSGLGAGTTIKFAFAVSYPSPEAPAPLTAIDLRYPSNLGVATSGLGLKTCRAARLEAQGPSGCPANSVMGYGSGRVEVPFGPQTVDEPVRLTVFMASLQESNLGLLFYASGESPVSAELIFRGVVLPAPQPFGGDLATTVPLVPTWPDAPDAVLSRFETTLGPRHITYWEYSKGRRIPYRPRGIRLPHECPRGGFRFAATLTFYGGAHADAQTNVPCPHRASRAVN